MTLIKVGTRVKTRSGKIGVVKALDWHEGKVISAGVEIDEPPYKEVVHQLIHNIMPV